MCSQKTGKIAKGYTFLITDRVHSGFSFRRNCLALEFNQTRPRPPVILKIYKVYRYINYILLKPTRVYSIVVDLIYLMNLIDEIIGVIKIK